MQVPDAFSVCVCVCTRAHLCRPFKMAQTLGTLGFSLSHEKTYQWSRYTSDPLCACSYGNIHKRECTRLSFSNHAEMLLGTCFLTFTYISGQQHTFCNFFSWWWATCSGRLENVRAHTDTDTHNTHLLQQRMTCLHTWILISRIQRSNAQKHKHATKDVEMKSIDSRFRNALEVLPGDRQTLLKYQYL